MNNKIKELAGQSLDKVVPYTWTNLTYDELWALQEYFGKLIVKECSSFLKDTLDDHFAAEQLEEHFRVE